MENQKFLFSVVIPIYDVELYLEESILSIVNQSIGFRDNIQLVLVNDGSPDKCDEICEKYKALYPDNVVYIKQENQGVSVARNNGIKEASGKYINFLDPDDVWCPDVFERIYAFFETHYDETDVVTTKINRFGMQTGPYRLNYRLDKGDRVADLTTKEEFNSVVVQVASSFFKAEAIADVSFIPNLKVGEDSMFVNSVIMKRMKVGFVSDAVYMYRKRENETSALQTSKKTDYFYINRIREYHLVLIKEALSRFEELPKYIQNVVYYDFGWHLAMPVNKQLSSKGYGEFSALCKEVLQYIDNGVICRNRVHTSFNKKNTALCIKHGLTNWRGVYKYDPEKEAICYKKTTLLKPRNSKTMLSVTHCDVADGHLTIEGLSAAWLYSATKQRVYIAFKVGDKIFKASLAGDKVGWISNCLSASRRYSKFTCKIPTSAFLNNQKVAISPVIYFDEAFSEVGLNYSPLEDCGEMLYEIPKIRENFILEYTPEAVFVTNASAVDLEKMQSCIADTVRKAYGESALGLRNQYIAYRQKKSKKKQFIMVSPTITDNPELLSRFMSEFFAKDKCKYIFLTNGEVKPKVRQKKLILSHKKLPLFWLRTHKFYCTENEMGSCKIFGDDTPYLWDISNPVPHIID